MEGGIEHCARLKLHGQAVSLAALWESQIELIVVNPVLSGIPEMVEALSHVNRPKIVTIGDPDVEADIPADVTMDRPDMRTPLSRAESADRVRRLLKELAGNSSRASE